MWHQMAHNHITCMLVICFMSAVASSAFDGARVGMRHFDYGRNISKDQLVAMSVFSSSYLSLKYRTYQYMIDFSIGTPGQAVSGIADTGSDLIWTQCYNCNPCFEQPTPLYDPRKSKTSSDPCNKTCSDPQGCCIYEITYGSGYTEGRYVTDTIVLGDTNPVSVPDILFGCSSESSDIGDTTGIVGLSRSEKSLISQLGISKFSYCLNPDANSINPMFLGSAAVLDGPGVRSTPFVALQDNEHYHVSLTGISLGSTLLPISKTIFEYDPSNPNSGVIIDSGTPVTRLVQQAFQAVSQAVQEAVNLQVADNSDSSSQLCFVLPSGSSLPSMPDMTFHFEGADLELPRDKYMQTGNGQFCLNILPLSSQSIIGTLQLKDMHVLYDLGNNMLSFAPAECDEL